jgi:CHAD domain-containing protein
VTDNHPTGGERPPDNDERLLGDPERRIVALRTGDGDPSARAGSGPRQGRDPASWPGRIDTIDRDSEPSEDPDAGLAGGASAIARLSASPPSSQKRLEPLTVWLRANAVELVRLEVGVRRGEVEAIHRCRVATRRLRSCLGTFGGAFQRGPARHLRSELAWLGGRLGAERDAQVVSERVDRDLDDLPRTEIVRSLRSSLDSRTHTEVDGAHRRLVAALDSARYLALLEELVVFAESPPYRTKAPSRSWLRARLSDTVRDAERLAARAKRRKGPRREIALHEVRKQAKHVRYAAEVLVPLLGQPAQRLARSFEGLQEALGEHHDAVVTRGLFREEASRSEARDGERGVAYSELFTQENDRVAVAEAAFRRAWKKRARRA